MGASGVGAFIGALYLASKKNVDGMHRSIPLAAGLFGLSLILFSTCPWFLPSLFLMFLSGFGFVVQMASCNTVLQVLVPDDKRGRVMSFYVLAFVGIGPFGCLAIGALASHVGAPFAVIAAGASSLLLAFFFAPSFVRMKQRLECQAEKAVPLGGIPNL